MRKLHYYISLAIVVVFFFNSCEKVSPIGVLVSGTGVEDRVKMSYLYFKQHKRELNGFISEGDEYTFLVGADSHMTTDTMRMAEMFQIGIDNHDLLYAHLGDIADTKAEYYIHLENTIMDAKKYYADKNYQKYTLIDENDDELTYYADTLNEQYYFDIDDIPLPFYPVVGNHDITHNGWALWSNIFHSSFYDFYVYIGVMDEQLVFDHFIFLDTANGTLGKEQVSLIEEGVLDDKNAEQYGLHTRHTFVFSHTNIFRPSSLQFASTFAREETFFLLNQFAEWKASIVFCGHVHKWDDHEVGGVRYITLDSMSERNSPDPGDYLVRVHVKKDGTISIENVHMNYTPNK